MARITAETIEEICTKDRRFRVPDRIKPAIESCFANDDESVVTEEYFRLSEEFQKYEEKMEPALIDYEGESTLDAYTAYYLPRYMSIPSVALRDLAIHPFFQNVPVPFSVLDLGSGTGAVVLGLLSLFSNSPLSSVALNITALDCCAEALDRQKTLIEKANFNPEQVHQYEADICDIDRCIKLAAKEGPYYLIFLANCLTELDQDIAIDLVGHLSEILADNGAIIIAEAQRNYIKRMTRTLATNVETQGLHVYYPCHGSGCPYNYIGCWTWREHYCELPSIEVSKQPLTGDPRADFVTSWLILTQQEISIYDKFEEDRPDLLWGPVSRKPRTGTKRSICHENRELPFKIDNNVSPRFDRGSIVGLKSSLGVEKYYQM